MQSECPKQGFLGTKGLFGTRWSRLLGLPGWRLVKKNGRKTRSAISLKQRKSPPPGVEFGRNGGLVFTSLGFGYCKTRVCSKQTAGLEEAKRRQKSGEKPTFLHKVAGFVQCFFAKSFDKVLRYNELGKIVENRVFATPKKRGGEYAILARRVVHFLYHFSAPSDTLSPRAGRKGSGGAGQGGEMRWAAGGRLSHRTPPLQHLLRIISPPAWCSAKNSLSLPKK